MFRIETVWLSPLDDNKSVDLFQHPYLDMVYYLQYYIMNQNATDKYIEFNLTKICYEPMPGEGCMIDSPMQYFWNNKTTLDGMGND